MIYIIPIYIKLKKINITKISSFNYLNWRNGYCYFKGVYLEKEVFIKVDTKMHLLINDKLTYDICKGIMKDELVEILHHSLDSRIQFIVYEFFNSRELDENILLNDMRYLDDIIRILNNLSKAGIIHRDIKLDNILLNNNNILVCDYEYCINTDDIGCNDDILNQYVGTELYMAPEIINREVNLNYKSVDIWNTALVIFVILTKGQLLMYDTFKYWRQYYNKDIIEKFFIYNENTYDFTNFFMLSLNPKNTKRQLLNIL